MLPSFDLLKRLLSSRQRLSKQWPQIWAEICTALPIYVRRQSPQRLLAPRCLARVNVCGLTTFSTPLYMATRVDILGTRSHCNGRYLTMSLKTIGWVDHGSGKYEPRSSATHIIWNDADGRTICGVQIPRNTQRNPHRYTIDYWAGMECQRCEKMTAKYRRV